MDETGLRSIFLWEKVPPTSSSFDIWVVDVSGLLIEEDASEGAPLDSWMYTSNIPQFRVHLIAIPGNNVAGKPGILVI